MYLLPVPSTPWEYLFMDFISGLPVYHGHTSILVVVDRFSKGIHLGMLPKHHGMPRSIISDRDPLFISRFRLAPAIKRPNRSRKLYL